MKILAFAVKECIFAATIIWKASEARKLAGIFSMLAIAAI